MIVMVLSAFKLYELMFKLSSAPSSVGYDRLFVFHFILSYKPYFTASNIYIHELRRGDSAVAHP